MKKTTFLFFTFCFLFLTANAQFSVYTNIGYITDRDILETQSTEQSSAELFFEIKNETDAPLDLRLKVISIDNTDGKNISLCFAGDCQNNIYKNAVYPARKEFVTVPAGDVIAYDQNKIWNKNEAGINKGEDITLIFEIQEIERSTLYVKNALQFTYQYKPVKPKVISAKEVNVSIQNTLIKGGKLILDTREPVSIQIYNLIGRQVKNLNLETGLNTIDISDLSAQIYLVRLQNRTGLTKTRKIVVE